MKTDGEVGPRGNYGTLPLTPLVSLRLSRTALTPCLCLLHPSRLGDIGPASSHIRWLSHVRHHP